MNLTGNLVLINKLRRGFRRLMALALAFTLTLPACTTADKPPAKNSSDRQGAQSKSAKEKNWSQAKPLQRAQVFIKSKDGSTHQVHTREFPHTQKLSSGETVAFRGEKLHFLVVEKLDPRTEDWKSISVKIQGRKIYIRVMVSHYRGPGFSAIHQVVQAKEVESPPLSPGLYTVYLGSQKVGRVQVASPGDK